MSRNDSNDLLSMSGDLIELIPPFRSYAVKDTEDTVKGVNPNADIEVGLRRCWLVRLGLLPAATVHQLL
jgi:hypothetical protein